MALHQAASLQHHRQPRSHAARHLRLDVRHGAARARLRLHRQRSGAELPGRPRRAQRAVPQAGLSGRQCRGSLQGILAGQEREHQHIQRTSPGRMRRRADQPRGPHRHRREGVDRGRAGSHSHRPSLCRRHPQL